MTIRLKNLLGVAGIFILVGMTGSIAAWHHFNNGNVTLDEELCPQQAVLDMHTVILVDQTDPLTDTQRRMLRHVINSEALRLDENAKLSVLALSSADPYEPDVLFSRCAPKSIQDVNEWTGNPNLAQAKWIRDFGQPLDEALDALMHVSVAPTSPIIESVKGLTWRHDFSADTPQRRLVIFSDMLQNTSGWSHYGRGAASSDYEKFSITQFAMSQRVYLNDAFVRIVYLERPETLHLQNEAHREFWLQMFTEAGAEVGFWSDEIRTEIASGS